MPVVATAGTVTTICVLFHDVYAVTFVPLNCTNPEPRDASKPEPSIVTDVEPATPSEGLNPVIETAGEQVWSIITVVLLTDSVLPTLSVL